jgi:hypothetical protein
MRPGRPAAVVAALVFALACSPVATSPGPPSGPVNTCQTNSQCTVYQQSGATPGCGGGACLVAATYSDLVFTVSLSTDSYFAPGQTLVLSSAALFDFQCTTTPCPCAPDPSKSPAGTCAQLPQYGIVAGAYLVAPSTETQLDWNLGNPKLNTALPVHVTYRPLWPQSGSLTTAVDAASVGLPVLPIEAEVVIDTSPSRPPGPNGGVSIGFQGYMQPADYECTISPDPPFDAAFPPDVQRVTIAAGNAADEDVLNVDTTDETPPSTMEAIPAFDLTRVEGLDGWTAYLEDATTFRRISSIATLSGTKTHVSLPTNHHPPPPPGDPTGVPDALYNAQLVMQPPTGQPVPMGVFPPIAGELPTEEPYPPLPAVATVQGTVTGAEDGAPVAAQLAFEAIDIYESGQSLPNETNFRYTGLATASIDPTTGDSTYSVILPPGDYSLTIRPTDTAHAVTVVQFSLPPKAGTQVVDDLTVNAPTTVQGSAVVGDGRVLAAATVEVVPVGCAQPGSTLCLPRGAQTITGPDGSFTLALDPGGYELRIRPQDGTRFPWVVQPLLVGPTPVMLAAATVPAPVYAGLKLLDAYGNPIVDAIVRAYLLPAQGSGGAPPAAVEIGEAITDATGQYQMYLAPTSQ